MDDKLRKYILSALILILVVSVVFIYKDKFFTEGEKIFKIGIIVDQDVQIPNAEGFKNKMAELGYIEGKNIAYIFKNPQSKQDLRDKYLEEIINSKPDLIVAASTIIATNLKKKNLDTPVIFMDVGTLSGVIENPLVPESNITGVYGGFVDFTGKRLELLKTIEPNIKKVIISPEKKFPSYKDFMGSLKEASGRLNIEVVEIPTNDAKDFISRLPEIVNKKNGDAFLYFTGPNNTPVDQLDKKKIVDQLIKEKLPAINHNMEVGANIGVLASYGNYRSEIGEEAALLADQIIKGALVKNVPVVLIKTLSLELNLKTAQKIGVSISKPILDRANKIY